MKNNNDPILEIMAFEIGFYILPQCVRKAQISNSLLETKNIDKKSLKKYFDYISDLNNSLTDVKKYPQYFEYLYCKECDDIEILQHHIHTFLQDLYRTEEKIRCFFNILKKDISQKKEYIESFQVQRENLFSDYRSKRNSHVHQIGKSLSDENVNLGRFFKQSLMLNDIENINFLSEYGKGELKHRYYQQLEEGRAEWIKKTKFVSDSISNFLNVFFTDIKQDIYDFLGIKTIDITK